MYHASFSVFILLACAFISYSSCFCLWFWSPLISALIMMDSRGQSRRRTSETTRDSLSSPQVFETTAQFRQAKLSPHIRPALKVFTFPEVFSLLHSDRTNFNLFFWDFVLNQHNVANAETVKWEEKDSWFRVKTISEGRQRHSCKANKTWRTSGGRFCWQQDE